MAVALAVAAAGAWRGSSGSPLRNRLILLVIRLTAIACITALLLNPGKWVNPSEKTARPWVILTDTSASMACPDTGGLTRAANAERLATLTTSHARDQDLPCRVHPFAATLGAPNPPAIPAATGTQTCLVSALSQVLQESGATGEALAGIIVLSDGRQTQASSPADLDALALRAHSRNVPVHTVAIGTGIPTPDLILTQPRSTLTAFAAQPIKIPFSLKSEGLDPIRATVSLHNDAGKEIATTTVEVPANKSVVSSFDIKAPSTSGRWTIQTPLIDREARRSNNSSSLNIRILDSKTRIFIAEGSPYWDSKFLAQLLRQQPHMDVQSVHRLSDQRYFRIDSGTNGDSETNKAVFPATLEELCRYDLIIFGKNTDPFITQEHAAALRSYVRDHGGAVLFARGNPTSTSIPDLEALEPVEWAATTSAEFRFTPTRDGEAAGLFGQALPAADASLWKSLPLLKDGRQVSSVKPFSRILADGVTDVGSNKSSKFPALVVRRYGQGVTTLVNGDGLWKWDFYPEARELGNCYEEFWVQLIQWMSSYSEFLPGQDFSLRMPSTHGESGQTSNASIFYRGATPVPQPLLTITTPDDITTSVRPAPVKDASGRPSWNASFTPNAPGIWKIKLTDPRPQSPPTPEVLFTVPTPLTENDDLSPDPACLETIARTTGGKNLTIESFPAFLKNTLTRTPPASRESGAVWQASWNTPLVAIAIAALLSLEWFMRRRNGHA